MRRQNARTCEGDSTWNLLADSSSLTTSKRKSNEAVAIELASLPDDEEVVSMKTRAQLEMSGWELEKENRGRGYLLL